jgi:RNA polymerase sigma-32 factor
MRLDPIYRRTLADIPTMAQADQDAVATRYAKTRDPRDAQRLVLGNLRLVVKIACELAGSRHVDLMDLVQEGNAGLAHAVNRFDHRRGVKLSSYAAWWIRAYIKQHLMQTSRIVRFSSTREGRRRYFDRTLPGRDISLDAPVHAGDDRGEGAQTAYDVFAAGDDARPDVCVEARELQARLEGAVAAFRPALDDRARGVFDMRLWREKPARLADVGKRFGISGERARQVETRVRAALHSFVADKLGTPARAAA